MDFHQLRIFLAVARSRSFSRGAEAVFLTQPTVSGHVKALERELGVPLFDRSQRELTLTQAGRRLQEYAQELMQLQEETLAAVQQESRDPGGHLELAASSVPGTYLLPGLLLAFHREFPRVTFSVRLRDSGDVLESLREGLVPVGFIGELTGAGDLGGEELTRDELVLITPPGHPLGSLVPEGEEPVLPLEPCLRYPFVLREPGSATRAFFTRTLEEAGTDICRLQVIALMEGQEAVKEAVRLGLGISVISRRAVEAEAQSGLLEVYRFAEMPLERSFFLVYRRRRLMAPLVQHFLDFTRQYFATRDDTIKSHG